MTVPKTLGEEVRDLLKEISSVVDSLNWGAESFEIEKAYCLSLFSQLAYCAISEEEYKRPERAKVVPCRAYVSAVTGDERIDVVQIMSGMDLGEIIVIRSRFFVAVIVFSRLHVIVVAVRGTQLLYDWYLNLSVGKVADLSGRYFHHGFITEAKGLSLRLDATFSDRYQKSKNAVPIYITGHSLGGAIAAILYALRTDWLSFEVHGCYTFGMPKYSNFASRLAIDHPYHCRASDDIVPAVPPRLLGYCEPLLNFNLDGTPYLGLPAGWVRSYLSWIQMLYRGEIIPNHAIERYRKDIKEHVGSTLAAPAKIPTESSGDADSGGPEAEDRKGSEPERDLSRVVDYRPPTTTAADLPVGARDPPEEGGWA